MPPTKTFYHGWDAIWDVFRHGELPAHCECIIHRYQDQPPQEQVRRLYMLGWNVSVWDDRSMPSRIYEFEHKDPEVHQRYVAMYQRFGNDEFLPKVEELERIRRFAMRDEVLTPIRIETGQGPSTFTAEDLNQRIPVSLPSVSVDNWAQSPVYPSSHPQSSPPLPPKAPLHLPAGVRRLTRPQGNGGHASHA